MASPDELRATIDALTTELANVHAQLANAHAQLAEHRAREVISAARVRVPHGRLPPLPPPCTLPVEAKSGVGPGSYQLYKYVPPKPPAVETRYDGPPPGIKTQHFGTLTGGAHTPGFAFGSDAPRPRFVTCTPRTCPPVRASV